jgi:transmembrane protein 33
MALVWLFSKQIPLALLPFSIYSTFHFLTYLRTNLIPTISPPQATTPAAASGASPAAKPTYKAHPVSEQIGNFVKGHYDQSMFLVAALELALWLRLFFSALIFQKGSWILLVVYTAFVRARFSQSSFVQQALTQLSVRIDGLAAGQGTPPAAKNAWETVKGLLRQFVDATDLNRYIGGSSAGPKKAQ